MALILSRDPERSNFLYRRYRVDSKLVYLIMCPEIRTGWCIATFRQIWISDEFEAAVTHNYI